MSATSATMINIENSQQESTRKETNISIRVCVSELKSNVSKYMNTSRIKLMKNNDVLAKRVNRYKQETKQLRNKLTNFTCDKIKYRQCINRLMQERDQMQEGIKEISKQFSRFLEEGNNLKNTLENYTNFFENLENVSYLANTSLMADQKSKPLKRVQKRAVNRVRPMKCGYVVGNPVVQLRRLRRQSVILPSSQVSLDPIEEIAEVNEPEVETTSPAAVTNTTSSSTRNSESNHTNSLQQYGFVMGNPVVRLHRLTIIPLQPPTQIPLLPVSEKSTTEKSEMQTDTVPMPPAGTSSTSEIRTTNSSPKNNSGSSTSNTSSKNISGINIVNTLPKNTSGISCISTSPKNTAGPSTSNTSPKNTAGSSTSNSSPKNVSGASNTNISPATSESNHTSSTEYLSRTRTKSQVELPTSVPTLEQDSIMVVNRARRYMSRQKYKPAPASRHKSRLSPNSVVIAKKTSSTKLSKNAVDMSPADRSAYMREFLERVRNEDPLEGTSKRFEGKRKNVEKVNSTSTKMCMRHHKKVQYTESPETPKKSDFVDNSWYPEFNKTNKKNKKK